MFRSPGSLVLSGAWLLVAVVILADLAVQGRDRAAVATAVLVIVITGVVYACAWRPRIVADAEGVTVANPLRDHWVPWGAVAKVDVVNAVRVHYAPAEAMPVDTRPGEAEAAPGGTTAGDTGAGEAVGGAPVNGAAPRAGARGNSGPKRLARGKIVYSWAVQSSPRSTMRAARRAGREARLSTLGALGARGYGQPPAEAKSILSRSPAEFTAAQLADRAERARRAGAMGGQLEVRWAWVSIAAMVVPIVTLVLITVA